MAGSSSSSSSAPAPPRAPPKAGSPAPPAAVDAITRLPTLDVRITIAFLNDTTRPCALFLLFCCWVGVFELTVWGVVMMGANLKRGAARGAKQAQERR